MIIQMKSIISMILRISKTISKIKILFYQTQPNLKQCGLASGSTISSNLSSLENPKTHFGQLKKSGQSVPDNLALETKMRNHF